VPYISHEIHALNRLLFWVCVGIAAVVFGAMIYSQQQFRRATRSQFEIVWTVIPIVILLFAALPAAKIILKTQDTRTAARAMPSAMRVP
jgi:cytochrome c oxidase subunit 2